MAGCTEARFTPELASASGKRSERADLIAHLTESNYMKLSDITAKLQVIPKPTEPQSTLRPKHHQLSQSWGHASLHVPLRLG